VIRERDKRDPAPKRNAEPFSVYNGGACVQEKGVFRGGFKRLYQRAVEVNWEVRVGHSGMTDLSWVD